MENASDNIAQPLASVAVLPNGPDEPAKLAEPVIHLMA